MIKEKRRKQRLLKKVLIAILVFMILSVIAVFVVVNVFVVKNVKVEGNELYEEQLITDTVLNDEYSWNSLYVLLKYTFIDIENVPFIDTMEVSLVDPQTLKIKVYEKLPVDNQDLRDLLTLTQTLKRDGLDPDIIHFDLKQSPVLSYGTKEVWLGSMELLTQKVTRLKEIMPSLEGLAGILHMEDWTEENANIIFEKELEVPNVDTEDASGENQDAEGEGENEAEPPQDDDSGEEN